MYEKYLELKKDFKEYVVFIKCGKFYRTYDEDAIIMNYLLCYQIMDNRLGFPLEGLFKVKNKLKSECINYVIADGVDIFSDVIDGNKYNEVLSLGRTEYDKFIKIEELIKLIRDKLNKDSNFYDKLKSMV